MADAGATARKPCLHCEIMDLIDRRGVEGLCAEEAVAKVSDVLAEIIAIAFSEPQRLVIIELVLRDLRSDVARHVRQRQAAGVNVGGMPAARRH